METLLSHIDTTLRQIYCLAEQKGGQQELTNVLSALKKVQSYMEDEKNDLKSIEAPKKGSVKKRGRPSKTTRLPILLEKLKIEENARERIAKSKKKENESHENRGFICSF
jgi:hypothetical protein